MPIDRAPGDDARRLLAEAEGELRAGRLDEGIALVRRAIERDINRRQDVALLGWRLAEQSPDIGYRLVELAADAAIRESDWASGAAGLQEFVTRVPNHIPALMRLVEICVDGGLEATMYSAQAHLADAYLAAGSAAEAKCLAEDLVAREPWERANIERFRQVLLLMGEPDPDAVIADRLSGESPFLSTDRWMPESGASTGGETGSGVTTRADTRADAAPPAARPPLEADDGAAQDYKLGTALFKIGEVDAAIPPLQAASRAPRLAFEAASLLARIFAERGALETAVEWMECAARAAAPTTAEANRLLYELAVALESLGHTARALAVCRELQAAAGDYADVGIRAARLARVQPRG